MCTGATPPANREQKLRYCRSPGRLTKEQAGRGAIGCVSRLLGVWGFTCPSASAARWSRLAVLFGGSGVRRAGARRSDPAARLGSHEFAVGRFLRLGRSLSGAPQARDHAREKRSLVHVHGPLVRSGLEHRRRDRSGEPALRAVHSRAQRVSSRAKSRCTATFAITGDRSFARHRRATRRSEKRRCCCGISVIPRIRK